MKVLHANCQLSACSHTNDPSLPFPEDPAPPSRTIVSLPAENAKVVSKSGITFRSRLRRGRGSQFDGRPGLYSSDAPRHLPHRTRTGRPGPSHPTHFGIVWLRRLERPTLSRL